MPRRTTRTPPLGRLAALCLTALSATVATAGEDLLGWRDARNMTELLDHLDRWLDVNSDLAPSTAPPRVRDTDEAAARARIGKDLHARSGGRPRGFYDKDAATIWLVRPWDARDPRDVAVLLHELVHHRQVGGHWYCDGAKELPAYRLQRDWLNALGLEPPVNWIAVVLESGCTPRDIHPE